MNVFDGRRGRTIALLGAALVLSGAGCSKVVNEGGDTPCKTFLTQDDGKQTDEVTKMLKDQGTSDPAELQIAAARTAAVTYCKTLGNENSKISAAPHL